MKLDDLLLKKEEIPIIDEIRFVVPVHPQLLVKQINTVGAANNTFSKAVNDWYKDLKGYVKELDDQEIKEKINETFLQKEPTIIIKYGRRTVDPLNWQYDATIRENGLVGRFSVDVGELFLEEDYRAVRVNSKYLKFSPEKFSEYEIKDLDYPGFDEDVIDVEQLIDVDQIDILSQDGAYLHVYYPEYIKSYPEALFLRNWSIMYLNEAIKDVYHPNHFKVSKTD